jgi:phage-related protein
MDRTLIFYKEYFHEFYDEQIEVVQKKIDWTLGLVRDLQMIPEKYFTHIEGTDGLYEIRVKVGSNIYRVFSFFDKGNLVIIANGFQKKTQKTPKNEIEKALRIKKEYEDENN